MAVVLGDAGHYVTVDLDYVVADYIVPPAGMSTTITATPTSVNEGVASIVSTFDIQADVGTIRGSVALLATSGNITANAILEAAG